MSGETDPMYNVFKDITERDRNDPGLMPVVLAWASERVMWIERVNPSGWDCVLSGKTFHAPTLYEALYSAWSKRDE